MALLTILHDPDPRLRIKAKPVTVFDTALQRLLEDMFETMYDAPGVGLAATQVGIALRIAVMDCADKDQPPQKIVMINPELSDAEDPQEMEEGCLRALDADGKPYELLAEGLLAQAIQHEIDHLDGKLYIDHLSSLKRERYKKKREKLAKRAA